ncbi:VOC family protein [Paenibacillus sp. UNC217MF]|uniref:VOC family protein n=1 Tax=Paenibacillus sp. UNC217MF TaxID=1449062 RepID=UPI00048DF31A|nr:VOC family protein [Paenibacillus sp. UNC217MF]
MLFLDHVTLAVPNLSQAVHLIQETTGIIFTKQVIPFPGTIGQVAYLREGFIELIALEDLEEAQKTPLGSAFAAFASQRAGIFGVALELTGGLSSFIEPARSLGIPYIGSNHQFAPLEDGTSISFQTAYIGPHMPWLIEYEQSRVWPSAYTLTGVEIQTTNIEEDLTVYSSAYQLQASIATDSGSLDRIFLLDRGWLSLHHTDTNETSGFNAVVLNKDNDTFRILCTSQGVQVTS